jgi:GntR family transcriptional regulator, carbon starvation induced regulator
MAGSYIRRCPALRLRPRRCIEGQSQVDAKVGTARVSDFGKYARFSELSTLEFGSTVCQEESMQRLAATLEADILGPDAPRTLAETVYRRLRTDIVWGRLAPDTPLRSDELRESYAVGISPLREALSRLVAERLVTAVGHRGFRVAPLTPADVIDTMETRLVIEKDALTRSIKAGDIVWEKAVVASFHAVSRDPVPRGPGLEAERWSKHHREFHISLLAACGSPWLTELAGMFFEQAERHRLWAVKLVIKTRSRMQRDVALEHKKLFDATMQRNVKAAVDALDRHYRTTAQQVVADLQSASSKRPNAVVSRVKG